MRKSRLPWAEIIMSDLIITFALRNQHRLMQGFGCGIRVIVAQAKLITGRLMGKAPAGMRGICMRQCITRLNVRGEHCIHLSWRAALQRAKTAHLIYQEIQIKFACW